MDIVTTLLIMAVCLLLEGFFSGSEIGVVSADQMKLRHAAAKGSKGAKLALTMLQKPEWLLSTTLVGTNIAVLAERDYITSGRTEISQLADNLRIELPAIHYSTVAGFMLQKTGSIPAKGRTVQEGRVTLTVHRRTAQAIQEVRIRWTD